MSGRGDRSVLPEVLGRLVDQRHAVAVEDVARLRAEFPSADPDTLADLLIRRCVRDMALGGAVTGGAAASPVAGVAVAAASAGTDAAWSVSRLGELVMGLGIVYGHDRATRQEKAAWIAAVLGLSEGAAVGVTGLAARLGARGGARLVARLPAVGAGAAGAGRVARAGSTMGRLATGRGPWSLAALVPYGIGAGVGAAGNAALAGAVGRTAKQYFTRLPPPPPGSDGRPTAGSSTGFTTTGPDDDLDEVIDVEVVEEIILDAEWFEAGSPADDHRGSHGN